MRKIGIKNVLFYLFLSALLVAEAVFYVFIITEAEYRMPFDVRYTAILFDVLLAALLFMRSGWVPEKILLLLAQIVTAAADYFLVIRWEKEEYFVAVLVFLVAQTLHFAHLSVARKSRKGVWVSLGVRILLTGVALTAVKFLDFWDPLNCFTVVYFTELLMNAVDAGIGMAREKRLIFTFIGFVLFVFCDITVGLNFIGDGLGIPAETLGLIAYLTWIFYLPSQVLIVLGTAPAKKAHGTNAAPEEEEK